MINPRLSFWKVKQAAPAETDSARRTRSLPTGYHGSTCGNLADGSGGGDRRGLEARLENP